MRSEGLTEWKAPDAMKRMWSVLTLPCLVCTVLPARTAPATRQLARERLVHRP